MGRNVGYIRTGITRGCHLGFRTAFFSFRFVYFFLCLVLSFSGTCIQSGRIGCFL